MGIPRFFRLISEQFPNCVTNTSFKQGYTLVVDNLYLDANGIIHNCTRESYFPKTPVNPRLAGGPRKPPTAAELELCSFEAIGKYMDQLLQFVKPRKVFYIAIDGPAPLAKQAQQRQRRFKAAADKTDDELAIFDSTAITPGTKFMYRLSRYIRFYIRGKMSTDPMWRKIKVIFSGPDHPGEGEHKIVQYIREQPNRNELTHCMYGLDADLFMLSLGTQCLKFYLLREDQFNTVWDDTLFYNVDINILRKEMFTAWSKPESDQNNFINDFIFVCFMVGNDFLHALPCCHDLVESINFVMELRKQVLEHDEYLTNGDGTGYNLDKLALLLCHLGSTEEQSIAGQYYHQNFPNLTLNNSLKNSKYPNQGIDYKKYRELYYAKAGVDHSDIHQVWEFCKHYLQGLEWVQYYYHAKPNNWHWYYPYHYSPLVNDLVDYLNNASNNSRLTRVSNKFLKPILPFQQLLCVVPPRSKALLPKYLQYLYHADLARYYPKTFKLDLEGKIREWEAIAILPFIRLEHVISAYNRAKAKSKEKEQKTNFARNKLGTATIFWHNKKSNSYNYQSDYGRITNCHVQFKELS